MLPTLSLPGRAALLVCFGLSLFSSAALAGVEICDGLDDDRDGAVDERCLEPVDRVQWQSLIPGTLGTPGRYCEAPFVSAEGADVQCPTSGRPSLTLGPTLVSDWYSLRHSAPNPSQGRNYVVLDLSPEGARPLDDWIIEGTFTLEASLRENPVRDGLVFGYLGLIFEEESPMVQQVSGIQLYEEQRALATYRGPYGPGSNSAALSVGGSVKVQLIKAGRYVDFFVDGDWIGSARSPATDRAATPTTSPSDPPLSHLMFACVGCIGTFKDLEVFQPTEPLSGTPSGLCRNRLLNPAFERAEEGVPEWWGLTPPMERGDGTYLGAEALRGALESITGEGGILRMSPPEVDRPPTTLIQPFPFPLAPPGCGGSTPCDTNLTLQVRARGLGGDAALEITLESPSGPCIFTSTGESIATLNVPANTEFETRSFALAGCPNSAPVYPLTMGNLILASRGEGTVELDAIQLEEGGPSPFCVPVLGEEGRGIQAPALNLPDVLTLSPKHRGQIHLDGALEAGEWEGMPTGALTPIGAPLAAQEGDSPRFSLSLGRGSLLLLIESAASPRSTLTVALDPSGGGAAWSTLTLDQSAQVLEAQGWRGSVEEIDAIGTCDEANCVLEMAIPYSTLALEGVEGMEWGLQVLHHTPDPPSSAAWVPTARVFPGSAAGAGRLQWRLPRRPWARVIPSPTDFEPADPAPPLWAQGIEQIALTGAYHDQSGFEQIADLGLNQVSLINVYHPGLPTYMGFGDAVNVGTEVHTFQLHSFWRADASRQVFFDYADAISEAHALYGEPHSWTLLDEPAGKELATCRGDLASGSDPEAAYQDVLPTLVDAMTAQGCGPTAGAICTSDQAYYACLGSMAALIDELVEDLKAALPPGVRLGINLTPYGVAEWGDELGHSLDYVSITHNWMSAQGLRALNIEPFTTLGAVAPQLPRLAYNDILGSSPGILAPGAPGARAHRGMSLLLLNKGALGLRQFTWPPSSPTLLEGLGVLESQLASLAPAIPQGRMAQSPWASDPEISTALFREEGGYILSVVNTASRPLRPRISLRGLSQGQVEGLFDAPTATLEAEGLDLSLGPFEGALYRLMP